MKRWGIVWVSSYFCVYIIYCWLYKKEHFCRIWTYPSLIHSSQDSCNKQKSVISVTLTQTHRFQISLGQDICCSHILKLKQLYLCKASSWWSLRLSANVTCFFMLEGHTKTVTYPLNKQQQQPVKDTHPSTLRSVQIIKVKRLSDLTMTVKASGCVLSHKATAYSLKQNRENNKLLQ